MTANQSVLTSKKPKEPSRKEDMNELRVAFNRVSIYDPLIYLDLCVDLYLDFFSCYLKIKLADPLISYFRGTSG